MEDILEKYSHLEEKDAVIYMALLRMGEMHIASITKSTGLKRSTVYIHIESLARNGLVEKIVRGKRIFYRASNPKRLLSSADSNRAHLESALPDLLSLFEARGKEPVVRVYTGKEGISTIYRLVETDALWVKTLFAPKFYYMVFTESESTLFAKNLENNGVKMQTLLLHDAVSKKLIKNESEFHHQLKLLPKTYDLTINIILWSQSVALISYEHLYAVVIENRAIAKFHENQFDALWRGK